MTTYTPQVPMVHGTIPPADAHLKLGRAYPTMDRTLVKHMIQDGTTHLIRKIENLQLISNKQQLEISELKQRLNHLENRLDAT